MATVSDGCVQELPAAAAAPALLFKTGAQSMHTRVGFDTPNLGIALLWAEQSLQAMRPQCRQWCLRRRAGKRWGVSHRDSCSSSRGGWEEAAGEDNVCRGRRTGGSKH